jgi:orotate phosphoribosyltransferase-like protein
MEHLSSGMEQQVQWIRDKVQELCSKGYSQREISHTLQVGLATYDFRVYQLSVEVGTVHHLRLL